MMSRRRRPLPAVGVRRFGSERGVTLVELLIAVTLVALLSMGMLFAMRTGLGALSSTSARLNDNRRVMSVQRILESQIAGMMPVPANCGGKVIFFQGTAETLRFITSYSMDGGSRGYPKVVEMQVIPGEGAGVRLVVNEYLYTGPDAAMPICANAGPGKFLPVQVGNQSLVLADKLAFCRFVFRDILVSRRPPGWLPLWSNPGLFPTGIRIEMTPLSVDPSRVPLETVTVPIHLTRQVPAPYFDELPR